MTGISVIWFENPVCDTKTYIFDLRSINPLSWYLRWKQADSGTVWQKRNKLLFRCNVTGTKEEPLDVPDREIQFPPSPVRTRQHRLGNWMTFLNATYSACKTQERRLRCERENKQEAECFRKTKFFFCSSFLAATSMWTYTATYCWALRSTSLTLVVSQGKSTVGCLCPITDVFAL